MKFLVEHSAYMLMSLSQPPFLRQLVKHLIASSSYIEYEHNIKKAAVQSMVNTHLCSGKYTTFMQSFDSSIDYKTVIKPKNSVEIYV